MKPSVVALLKRRDVQKRALVIAVIVGTILNCINQAPDLMQGASLEWVKAGLTYCVPYCVSLYSSIAALRRQ